MCLCLPDWLACAALLCCLVIGPAVPWCLRAAYVTTKTRWFPTGADTSSNIANLKEVLPRRILNAWFEAWITDSVFPLFLYFSHSLCIFNPTTFLSSSRLTEPCLLKEGDGGFWGGNGGDVLGELGFRNWRLLRNVWSCNKENINITSFPLGLEPVTWNLPRGPDRKEDISLSDILTSTSTLYHSPHPFLYCCGRSPKEETNWKQLWAAVFTHLRPCLPFRFTFPFLLPTNINTNSIVSLLKIHVKSNTDALIIALKAHSSWFITVIQVIIIADVCWSSYCDKHL